MENNFADQINCRRHDHGLSGYECGIQRLLQSWTPRFCQMTIFLVKIVNASFMRLFCFMIFSKAGF